MAMEADATVNLRITESEFISSLIEYMHTM